MRRILQRILVSFLCAFAPLQCYLPTALNSDKIFYKEAMKPRAEGMFLVSWLPYSIGFGVSYAALRLYGEWSSE